MQLHFNAAYVFHGNESSEYKNILLLVYNGLMHLLHLNFLQVYSFFNIANRLEALLFA